MSEPLSVRSLAKMLAWEIAGGVVFAALAVAVLYLATPTNLVALIAISVGLPAVGLVIGGLIAIRREFGKVWS